MKIGLGLRTDIVSFDARHHSWIIAARGQIEDVEVRESAASRGSAGSAAASSGSLPVDFFPGYDLKCEIHRGGQGIVFQAVQKSTRRTVAIKMIREAAFAGPLERSRFEREVQVLAALKHPNIVAIHDSGSAAGHLYFVMDFIAGQPLDLFVASEKRPVAEVLRLFATICDAVNAAHLLGIVHRDIKPGNIRVASNGIPYVVDFGLARHADSSSFGAPGEAEPSPAPMTVTGQFVGSLPWATPEQADGRSSSVDQRSDVYSLGVVLFQILTGKFPYPVAGKMRRVLDNITQAPPVNPRTLCPEIDDEVATIVLTCLSKDPARRYQTAGDLAADIRGYLSGEPIAAKRDSAWYVLRKSVRRYRGHVAVAAIFVLTVTAAAIALSILYGRQGSLLTEVRHQRDKALTAEELARQRLGQAEFESYAANIAAADAAIAVDDGGAAFARLQSAPVPLRNWEWHYLIRQADQSIATWHGPEQLIVGQVGLSEDAQYVGASFWMEKHEGAVRVWQRSPSPVSAIPAETPAARFAFDESSAFAFLHDIGQLLICRSGGDLVRFDLASRQETGHTRLASPHLAQATFLPTRDGGYLIAAASGAWQLWDARSGRHVYDLKLPQGLGVSTSSFDPTGQYLATCLSDGTLTIWDAVSGRAVATAPTHLPGIVYGLAPSPNGRTIAVALGETGQIELWEVADGQDMPTSSTLDQHVPVMRMIRSFHCGSQRVAVIAFSPDGQLLAAPSADKAVRLWNIDDGTLRTTCRGHTTPVVCADFSRDGRLVVSGGTHGEVKLWDVNAPPPVHVFLSFSSPVNSVAFMPDGARLLLNGGSLCIADLSTGSCLHELQLSPANDPHAAVPGPGASQVTFSNPDGSILIWDISASGESRTLGAHKSMPSLAAAPSKGVLASADADAVILWDWDKGRELRRLPGPGESVRRIAVSPDAARLALGLATGALHICDSQTGRKRSIEHAHGDAIQAVAFSRDGHYIATGSVDCTIKFWDAETGTLLWTASPQLGDVWCIAFSPDGTRMAVGGRDRSVRILDARTGRELLALRGPTGTVMCVAFSDDGRRIAAGSWAHEVVVWEAATAQPPE